MMPRRASPSLRRRRPASALGLAALASLAVSTAPGTAWSQDPVVVERQATDGVDRPIHDLSGEGDASSIELNPALLSGIRGFDLVFRGYNSNDTFGRGDGYGAFFAVGAMGIAAGFDVQALRPGFDDGAFDAEANLNPAAVKVGGGIAAGDSERGSLGVAVHGLRAGGEWIRGADFDVGVLARVGNYASLGLTARLSPAELQPTPSRTYVGFDSELSVRPLGTRWLEVAGGVRTRIDASDGSNLRGFSGSDLYPHGRLALRWQGLTLAGEIEQVPTVVLDADTLEVAERSKALRGGVAIGLNWDYLGADVGVHAGPRKGVGGVGYAVRFSSQRMGRAVWTRPVDVERIELAQVRGERDHLRMLTQIERATRSGGRSILLLDARGVAMGWASMEELREALIRARNAGVHIFAYLENASLADYYLASVAEAVFVHPAGELALLGMSSTGLYFKDALAKLGVKVESLHIKEYKSAHEQFTRADRSSYDREQREALLDADFDTFLEDTAQARQKTIADARAWVDDAPLGPDEALERGLIDDVLHRDEILRAIEERVGMPVEEARIPPIAPDRETWGKAPYYAIVVIEGSIVDGKSLHVPFLNLHFTGGDTVAEQLRKLRRDPACKGIVLRVNSPGGSALASEIIHREVERTHQAWEKDPKTAPPIVTSMGDVAASGGYYVSAGTRQVYAMPTTITGSIGVVSMHFDISGLLEKLGIGVDTLKRGPLADVNGFYRAYTDVERERLEASMRRIYDMFRQRVADARGMTIDQVDQLGRGHVYSGRDALKIDLVDEMGGLHEAVEWLDDHAQRPKLVPLELRVFPRREGLLSLILEDSGLVGEKLEQMRAAKAAAKRPALPPTFDQALARMPLSLLFLPQGQAQLLVPWIMPTRDTLAP